MKTAEQLAKEHIEGLYDKGEDLDIIQETQKGLIDIFLAGYNAREQWISVKDELPEIRKKYLLIDRWGNEYVGRLNLDTHYYDTSGLFIKEVTHFQELPNAPKLL